jgi:hypothetical protein
LFSRLTNDSLFECDTTPATLTTSRWRFAKGQYWTKAVSAKLPRSNEWPFISRIFGPEWTPAADCHRSDISGVQF